jgi:3-hydroxyisobutyrate dehydrogenase-like beta-hydroxyacid dehydrogenase
MNNIAFIGLGTMGYPMAGHLACKGFSVRAFNRTTSKAESWQREYGCSTAPTPAAAAADADIVITCVGNDDDLRSVVWGENGAASTMKEGAILVDHSTVSASLARELATTLASQQVDFIDAPVSGGQQGAQNGQLTIMCGGDPHVFAQVKPVLACFAKAVTLMGPSGAGQLTKMVNQICVAGLVEALSEGMYFAEKAGLDVQKVIEAISQGAASSWQMVNRHQTMIRGEYNHGFAVDWMRKDLAICLDEAERLQIALPVTQQVDTLYAEVQSMGGGRWDTSSLLARLKKA